MATTNPTPLYLEAEFSVSRANHLKFKNKMKEILPVILDEYGWELIYAAYPVIGNINRFIHIWRIPNESSVLTIMRDGAEPEKEGDKSVASAGKEAIRMYLFKALYRELQGIISDTTHTLTTSLPHDPTYFGHQSQTLLVDVNGEAFLIDHAHMRATLGETKDLADELRKERTRQWRPWEAAPELDQHKCRKQRPHTARKLDKNRARTLQFFLNQGALVASLPSTNHGTHSLLFNLAGIKPRSVFQEEPKADDDKSAALSDLNNGDVEFPNLVKHLIIATPWGAVYHLDKDDINSIASPLPPDKIAGTAALLKPLIEARVPLANIPEERDEVIGDGCMCYVINLASFAPDVGAAAALEQGRKNSAP